MVGTLWLVSGVGWNGSTAVSEGTNGLSHEAFRYIALTSASRVESSMPLGGMRSVIFWLVWSATQLLMVRRAASVWPTKSTSCSGAEYPSVMAARNESRNG